MVDIKYFLKERVSKRTGTFLLDNSSAKSVVGFGSKVPMLMGATICVAFLSLSAGCGGESRDKDGNPLGSDMTSEHSGTSGTSGTSGSSSGTSGTSGTGGGTSGTSGSTGSLDVGSMFGGIDLSAFENIGQEVTGLTGEGIGEGIGDGITGEGIGDGISVDSTVSGPNSVSNPGQSNGYEGESPDCLGYQFTTYSMENPISNETINNSYSITEPVSFLDLTGDAVVDDLSASMSGGGLKLTVDNIGDLTLLDYNPQTGPDSVFIEGITYPAELFFELLLAGENPGDLLTLLAMGEAGITDEALEEHNQSVEEIDQLVETAEGEGSLTDEAKDEIAETDEVEAVEAPLAGITTIDEVQQAFADMQCSVELVLPEDIEVPDLISADDVESVNGAINGDPEAETEGGGE